MKITNDNLFKNSFVITINDILYNRFIDKFLTFTRILPKKFIGFTVPNGIYKNAGFIKSNNVINCTLSHIALIKYAQMLDMPFICIFEDDAYPCKDISDKLQTILNDIPDDCDILKFGILHSVNKNNKIIINKYLEKNKFTSGSHAYVVFKRYYEKYFKYIYKSPIADDFAINDNKSNIYNTIEPLFIQYNQNGMHKNDPLDMTINTYTKEWLLENFEIEL